MWSIHLRAGLSLEIICCSSAFMCFFVCLYVHLQCMYAGMHVCRHACMHVYAYLYVYMHTCAHIIPIHIHKDILHKHIHIHTMYTRVYSHTLRTWVCTRDTVPLLSCVCIYAKKSNKGHPNTLKLIQSYSLTWNNTINILILLVFISSGVLEALRKHIIGGFAFHGARILRISPKF